MSTYRVLIVEDNQMLALAMAQMVEDLGYAVIGPITTLNDGVSHAQRDELDFALLDFNLGAGTDATPIAEALTQRGVPFAFTTASDGRLIRQSFDKAIIIAKPVCESDLEKVLPN